MLLWGLAGFVILIAICRVMMASKSIDYFIAMQNAETDKAQPRTFLDSGRVVPFARKVADDTEKSAASGGD